MERCVHLAPSTTQTLETNLYSDKFQFQCIVQKYKKKKNIGWNVEGAVKLIYDCSKLNLFRGKMLKGTKSVCVCLFISAGAFKVQLSSYDHTQTPDETF